MTLSSVTRGRSRYGRSKSAGVGTSTPRVLRASSVPERRERVRTSARAGRECRGVDQVILAEEQKANTCGPRVDVLTGPHVANAGNSPTVESPAAVATVPWLLDEHCIRLTPAIAAHFRKVLEARKEARHVRRSGLGLSLESHRWRRVRDCLHVLCNTFTSRERPIRRGN